MTYIEGFITPIPQANRAAYLAHSEQAAVLLKEMGVVRMVECWADDVPHGTLNDLWRAVDAKPDEAIAFSWFEYPDRMTRDAASARMMNDPRFADMMTDMPFDGKRMIYAGFDGVHDPRFGDGATYIDGVVMPIRKDARDAYAAHATALAGLFADVGALRVMDAIGDDVPAGQVTDYHRAIHEQDGETAAFGWIEWPDKATRDAGWGTLMSDDRLNAVGPPPFDGKRMMFGGFAVILDR